jgi:hypothetical protein
MDEVSDVSNMRASPLYMYCPKYSEDGIQRVLISKRREKRKTKEPEIVKICT